MKNGLENIDEVFKQAFDGFEANVDPSIWTNIQSSIATGTTPPTDPVSTSVATTATKTVALKIAAAVIAVGTIATATFFVVTPSKETKEVVAENNIEQPAVELVEEATFIEETNETKNEIIVKEVAPVVINKESTIEDNKKDNEIPVIENQIGTAPTNNQKTKTADNQKEAESQNYKEDSNSPTKTNEKPTIEKTVNTDKEKEETTDTPKIKPKTNVKITNTIPTIFTPNGDGMNDIFKITGENIDKMEVAIMDKTGKVLYWLKSVEDEWQGKDMGGYDLPSGVYFIAGSVKDKEENTQMIKQVIQLNR